MLARFVGGAGADGGSPGGDGLRTAVLIHRLIGALREGGNVVDGSDGEGEGGRLGDAGRTCHGIGERIGAVHIRGGGVEKGRTAHDSHGTEGWRRDGSDDRRPLEGIVRQDIQRDRLILKGRAGVADDVSDGGDGEGEGLVGRSVHAAVRRAAVVVQVHSDGGGAVGVRCRSVGEDTAGRDGRLHVEECGVVIRYVEGQLLARFVGGAGADGGSPGGDGLRTAVLIHRLIGALREGGNVVDGSDGEGDGRRA